MLPTHSANRNNGLSGISKVNKHVLMTICWFFLSIFLVCWGVWHCRANAYNYRIECDANMCSVSSNVEDNKMVQFNRGDFLGVELVNINNKGELIDTSTLNRRDIMRFPTTLQLKFNKPVEENSRIKIDKKLLFTPLDMGKRLSRSGVKKMEDYLNKRINAVKIDSGRLVTVFGLLAIFFGFISIILACACACACVCVCLLGRLLYLSSTYYLSIQLNK